MLRSTQVPMNLDEICLNSRRVYKYRELQMPGIPPFTVSPAKIKSQPPADVKPAKKGEAPTPTPTDQAKTRERELRASDPGRNPRGREQAIEAQGRGEGDGVPGGPRRIGRLQVLLPAAARAAAGAPPPAAPRRPLGQAMVPFRKKKSVLVPASNPINRAWHCFWLHSIPGSRRISRSPAANARSSSGSEVLILLLFIPVFPLSLGVACYT